MFLLLPHNDNKEMLTRVFTKFKPDEEVEEHRHPKPDASPDKRFFNRYLVLLLIEDSEIYSKSL